MKKAITFYYSEDSGEHAKTLISPDFQGEDSLMKADVLQDFLSIIEEMYIESRTGYFEKALKEISND